MKIATKIKMLYHGKNNTSPAYTTDMPKVR